MHKGNPRLSPMPTPSLTALGFECEAAAVAKEVTVMTAGVVDVADGGEVALYRSKGRRTGLLPPMGGRC
jgi:hypothetical protein